MNKLNQKHVTVAGNDLLAISTAALSQISYSDMHEIAKAVAGNPSLLADFAADPAAAAHQINGFRAPAGFHIHVADAENRYYPAEDDALAQISTQPDAVLWSRIEVRAGFGPMACIVCLWCKTA